MSRNALLDFKRKIDQMASTPEMKLLNDLGFMVLAARFLRKVMKRTPVGKGSFEVERDNAGGVKTYQKGKRKGQVKLKRITNGGTLRRGWTAKTYQEAKGGTSLDVTSAAESLRVARKGRFYEITITNVVPYASFVELGHRQEPGRFVPVLGKRLKNGWVEGQFMMKISAEELAREAPDILRKRFKAWLEAKLNT